MPQKKSPNVRDLKPSKDAKGGGKGNKGSKKSKGIHSTGGQAHGSGNRGGGRSNQLN